MPVKRRSEQGQVLVLVVVALVVLLGFVALAIDGGMIYSDRRNAQNVADSAALAGAQRAVVVYSDHDLLYSQSVCNTPSGQWVTSTNGWPAPDWLKPDFNAILQKARDRATINGMNLDLGLDNQNGVAFRCGTENGDRYMDVRVIVTATTRTSFLHFVYGGPVVNTVEAIARARPTVPSMIGLGLYALDPNCAFNGIDMRGGGHEDVNVSLENGASSFSRSCSQGNGTTQMTADTGTNRCLYSTGHPNWCDSHDDSFDPRLEPVTTDPYNFDFTFPNCNDPSVAPPRTINDADTTIEPGMYDNDNHLKTVHSALKLNPGLYCIKGNIKVNSAGGSLTSQAGNGYPEGVTVIFLDGTFDASGNGQVHLKAPLPVGPHAPHAFPGVILAMAPTNDHNRTLDLTGNSGSGFQGTVYVPDGEVWIGGTSSSVAAQIIARNIRTHGTSDTTITWNGDLVASDPPSISLLR